MSRRRVCLRRLVRAAGVRVCGELPEAEGDSYGTVTPIEDECTDERIALNTFPAGRQYVSEMSFREIAS
jgi:hypothetical protein